MLVFATPWSSWPNELAFANSQSRSVLKSYNPGNAARTFVPGVIGIVLQIATTFATAMSLVRERERGTLEQLMVSPLSRWGLMLGKLAPYLLIGMLMAVSLFAIMQWLFHVPISGDFNGLIFATFLYVFCLLSLGLLISTRAQNQIQAARVSSMPVSERAAKMKRHATSNTASTGPRN
jgi:ABC-type multidrug transport system permease subunit